jgi:hypothetical protein
MIRQAHGVFSEVAREGGGVMAGVPGVWVCALVALDHYIAYSR